MLSSALALAIGSCPAPAEAQQGRSADVDIAAGTLPAAIAELSREADVSIGTEGNLPQLRTPAIKGRMSIDAALARLLGDSGYVARRVGPRAWRIERRRRAAPVPAPTPAPSAPQPVPEVVAATPIIVTGSKRANDLSRLPMAAAVVQFDPDAAAGTSSGSARIAAGIEGLSLSGQGPGRNRMFLRGVADSAFNGESQSTVAVVVDEARVTYSAPDPDLRLVDVERVEVLKGPHGSLYGAGALGGIYRIVTRKPELDETSLAVSAGGQASASGDAGHALTLVANLPVLPDHAALRLVGYSGYDPGWIDTGTRRDSNGTRLLGGRAAVGMDFGGGWEAQLGGLVQLLDSQDTQYVYAPRQRRRPAQLPEPHDNDLTHFAFRLTGRLGDARLVASSGYTTHELRDELDATIGAGQFGLADPQRLIDERQFTLWDSEVRLDGRWGGVDWLLGIAHLESRQDLALTLESASVPAALVLDDDRRTNSDSALFGDVSLRVADGVRIEAGARLFASTTVESRTTAIGPVARRQTKRGVTPTFALSWTPRAGRLVYLRYGSAFRPGGADIAANGELKPLESDELQTIEAGWRAELDGGGKLEFGAYYSRWENIQSDLLEPDGLLESANIGDGEIIGAEASAALPLGRGWSLDAGAGVTHAVLVREAVALGSDDRHLPVVPEYTLRAGVRHAFDLAGEPASIGLSLRYLGPARLSFDPAIDRPMGKVLESSLTARARLAGMDVAVEIENLFDRRDSLFAYGNPLRFASAMQYTPQAPLSARITLRKAF